MFAVKRTGTRTALKALVFLVACSLASLSIPPFGAAPAQASTTIDYTFNTAGQLAGSFNSYTPLGTFAQTVDGGISNTGAIGVTTVGPSPANLPRIGNSSAVFTTKPRYSIGAVGSTYEFSGFAYIEGGNGYTGFGFTAATPPAAGNVVTGPPFRPADALGVSVHGGGFIFHNGVTDASENWTTPSAGGGITTIKSTGISQLVSVDGSPSKWFKIVFKLTRDSATTFDARVEIWPSSSAGVLTNPAEAAAIFEYRDITNTALINAPAIYSYINFSGSRVTYLDDYKVNLTGNSSVIEENAPVVLTTATTEAAGVVNFTGNVTSAGSTAVTEKGFVYDAAPDAVITDSKVAVGTGTGTISGATSQLANGDYYFRAYATNGTGTSYGSENLVTITAGAVAAAAPASVGTATATVAAPKVSIVGSVQFDGNSKNNSALAKARAREVRAYLKANGLADATFMISSKVLVGKLSNSRASMITVTYPGQLNKKKVMTSTYYVPYSSALDSDGKKSLRTLVKTVNANR